MKTKTVKTIIKTVAIMAAAAMALAATACGSTESQTTSMAWQKENRHELPSGEVPLSRAGSGKHNRNNDRSRCV